MYQNGCQDNKIMRNFKFT